MLPSMTSSKSSRASIMPSSISLSALRSSPINSDLKSEPESASKTQNKRLQKHQRLSEPRSTQPNGEQVPRPLQKSKTWSNRLSSFLPSLITNDTDFVPRKPIVSSHMSMPPPDSAPPPCRFHDPSSPTRDDLDKTHSALQPMPHERLPGQPNLPISGAAPVIRTLIPDHSLTNLPNPEIMSPIPPSPEIGRGVLTKQQPAPRPDALRTPPQTPGESKKNASPKYGKLQKENRSRRNSLQQLKDGSSSTSLSALWTGSTTDIRGRSVSAQTPTIHKDVSSGTRVTSFPLNPPSVSSQDGSTSHSPSRGRRRRSWFPTGGSRSSSTEIKNGGPKSYAWVMSEGSQAEYNPTFLNNGEKVPELWNESGNVLVYLYPQASGCGPSFKVMDFTVSSSYIFNEIIQSTRETPLDFRIETRSNYAAEYAARLQSPPRSPVSGSPGDLKLYLPAVPLPEASQTSAAGQSSNTELDRLIAIRNLFAFLTGQPLVATKARPTTFHAFLQISELLEAFGFSSIDGTTFGNAVDLSFEFYSEQLGLADCRDSREKTIEALILGERMRSMDLYSEAFAHAAGKYSAIVDLRLPLFEMVSVHTRQQLEKSHFDLVQRQHNVNEQLEQFEFPALFAGIANRTSMTELKQVRFTAWRKSFNKMRSFVLSHYKTTFGNWPPKASSSKNPFAESGLNRLVLKMLYSDMCALYDLLVDRNSLTSRVMDEVPALSNDPDKMTVSALRNILSEFDRSRPPVLPPIPYDLPQLPSMTSIFEAFNGLSAKEQTRFEKNIKEHELALILNKAYNYDTNRIKLPFLEHFKDFELREGKGKMASELVDQRIGHWLFLYVIVQSLPMLVVDAPDLKFTEGSEYFLCQPPMGNPPWMEDRQVRKMWYEVAGGGGLVELSTDVVLFSVEATYRRSHCWLAANAWKGMLGAEAPRIEEPALPALLPPPSVLPGSTGSEPFISTSPTLTGVPGTPTPPPGSPQLTLRPQTLSPGGSRASQAYRSSIAMGLEPVPMEPGSPFGTHHRSSSQGPRPMSSAFGIKNNRSSSHLPAMDERPASSFMPAASAGATFDDILAGSQKKPTKKKGFFF